jgi:hypothetical protein
MRQDPAGKLYAAATAVFVLTVIVAVSLAMRSTVSSSGCTPGMPCDPSAFSPDSGPAFLSLVLGLGLVIALALIGFVVRRRHRFPA